MNLVSLGSAAENLTILDLVGQIDVDLIHLPAVNLVDLLFMDRLIVHLSGLRHRKSHGSAHCKSYEAV